MYLARFCYDVAPTNRERALNCIGQEAEAARERGRNARILVALARARGGAALQFEIELTSLNQLEEFPSPGVGSDQRLDACL